MISSKEIKIKRPEKFDSDLIEKELSDTGYDVLRWAITACDDESYTVNIAFVENC